MDSDQDLLDAANARDDARQAAEWRLKKAAQQRHESAAKEAHKIRQMHRLLLSQDARDWDRLPLVSQRHLIADAENVAANPNITAAELHRLYQERLLAWGDTDSADLRAGPLPIEAQVTEDQVLSRLKELLESPSPESVNG